jgi:hypothetical protein
MYLAFMTPPILALLSEKLQPWKEEFELFVKWRTPPLPVEFRWVPGDNAALSANEELWATTPLSIVTHITPPNLPLLFSSKIQLSIVKSLIWDIYATPPHAVARLPAKEVSTTLTVLCSAYSTPPVMPVLFEKLLPATKMLLLKAHMTLPKSDSEGDVVELYPVKSECINDMLQLFNLNTVQDEVVVDVKEQFMTFI